jgi:glycosyltransferase involved in cell wall biosynthesis
MKNYRLVIALPVYNGEKYVAKAIESILEQTFSDYHLLIGDNASTDSTEEICREYAKKDNRITYHRHRENIGASPNYNFLFQPQDATYFKWAAHDDILQPRYLEKCIQLLDDDPSLAIAHSLSVEIDEEGKQLRTYDCESRLNGFSPQERFKAILWINYFNEVFGVMRTKLLWKTKLYGSYVGADRNFLAEMILLGNVGYLEEYLFCRRHHPEAFTAKLKDDNSRLQWFNPNNNTPAFLASSIKFKEYLSSIYRLVLPASERIVCTKILLEWAILRAKAISSEKIELLSHFR